MRFKGPKFLVVVLFMSMLASSVEGASVDQRTIALLIDFRNTYSTSMLNGDPESIVAYYSDDIRLMPEFQMTMMTKQSALLYHHAFLDRFDVTAYSRKELEILDLGARVVEFGLLTMTMKLKSNGEQYTLNGKYGNIWQRSSNNKLRLVTESWNYNERVSIGHLLQFANVPTVNVSLQAHVPVNTPLSFELAAMNHFQELVITARDAKIWSQFYADDFMLLTSNSPVIKGRKDVDAYIEQHVMDLPIFENLSVRTDHIDDLGDYVIEYANHIAVVRVGDWSGVSTGKDFRIWRREKNGSLKIFRGMGMYD